MVSLAALWLPILLSAIGVFVVSSLVHMVFTYHRHDYDKLPNEDTFTAFLKEQKIEPGNYFFPHAMTAEERKKPEVVQMMTHGPAGSLTLMPGFQMGKSMITWIILCLVIEILVAYVATLCLGRGAEPMAVFRLTATVALLGFAGCAASDSIWMGRRWATSFRHIFDGLLYALVSSGIFVWLWPS